MRRSSKQAVLALAALLAIGACSQRQTAKKKLAAVFASGGPKVGLRLVSLFPGVTNVGHKPALTLIGGEISPEMARAIGRALQEKVVFIADDGADRVGARVNVEDKDAPSGGPGKAAQPRVSADHTFVVMPQRELKEAVWYDVRLISPLSNAAIFADDHYDLGTDTVTRFFTASSPQLRRVDIVQNEGSSTASLLVQMSEEVYSGDLDEGMAVAEAGRRKAGCRVWNGECDLRSEKRGLLSGFEYRLAEGLPETFTVSLGLGVRGRDGTSVGKGLARPRAVRGGEYTAEDALVYSFERSALRQRRDHHVLGWANSEQTPGTKEFSGAVGSQAN